MQLQLRCINCNFSELSALVGIIIAYGKFLCSISILISTILRFAISMCNLKHNLFIEVEEKSFWVSVSSKYIMSAQLLRFFFLIATLLFVKAVLRVPQLESYSLLLHLCA